MLRHFFDDGDNSVLDLFKTPQSAATATSICGGRFRLERFLGEGAFGIVHLALDTKLARYVAIKLPRPHSLPSRAIYHRAIMEARYIASLDHPHIVRVHEVLETAGVPVIVSAFCEGITLSEWRTHQPSGRVLPADAATIIRDLASALAHAHQRGVLHRDIKPNNVLILANTERIHPMLMDFGLSRRIDVADPFFRGPCGTHRYMAPEVIASENQLDSTVSDIYSLGVVLCELLTGTTCSPTGDDVFQQLAAQHDRRFLIRRRSQAIDRDIFAIVQKCLMVDPSLRYQSAADLQDDLQLYLDDHSIRARRTSTLDCIALWFRRDPAKSTLWLAVALVSLISVALLTSSYRNERVARALVERRNASIRSIVHEMSAFVADRKLRTIPRLDSERLDLLERSVRVARELVSDDSPNIDSLHELSIALHYLANARSNRGDVQAARIARAECLALIAKLQHREPDNEIYAYDEFMNLLLMGSEWRTHDGQKTEYYTQQARHVIEQLIDVHPTNADYRDAMIAVISDTASDLHISGHMEEAKSTWSDVIKLSRELASEYPDRPLYLKHAANAVQQLGRLAIIEHDYAIGNAHLCESLSIVRDFQKQFPEELFFVEEEGSILAAIADAHGQTGEFDECLTLYREAIDIFSKLMERQPESLKYPIWVASQKNELAQRLLDHGRTEDAIGEYSQAIRLLEDLLRKYPHLQDVQQRIDDFHNDRRLSILLKQRALE